MQQRLKTPERIEPMTTTMPSATPRRSMTMFWMVVAVCLAPVVASYVLYYGVRPEGRTNHGDLIEPQRSVGALPVTTLVRAPGESGFVDVLAALPKDDPRQQLASLQDFRGRWLLVRVGPATCGEVCQSQLWMARQVRLATGRERDRVERLWIIPTAPNAASTKVTLPEEHLGTWVLSADAAELESWPLPVGSTGVGSHLWLVDPLGNLMMRFPADPDPAKIRSDLMKLLKASRIG
jgi:hypothetical protein